MQLTAVFETWHLGDGNYPPLHKGQLVRLSFEFMPDTLVKTGPQPGKFEHIKDGGYKFAGIVLKIYGDPPSGRIVVVQADDFRFYINSFPPESAPLKEGDRCEGTGNLLFDHYIWVQFLANYKDPPDLFYSLRVTSIRAVKIPESFISRTKNAQAGPASLALDEYTEEDITEVEKMEDFKVDWSFFLVALDDSGVGTVNVPRTFHS
ncbi:MAG: hypothetical protein WAN14_05345 [Candidatus Acidiferrales bacterium]